MRANALQSTDIRIDQCCNGRLYLNTSLSRGRTQANPSRLEIQDATHKFKRRQPHPAPSETSISSAYSLIWLPHTLLTRVNTSWTHFFRHLTGLQVSSHESYQCTMNQTTSWQWQWRGQKTGILSWQNKAEFTSDSMSRTVHGVVLWLY